jgi:hypothetical protein
MPEATAPEPDSEPSVIEQAKEAARDDPSRRELTNLLYDLPGVHEVLVDGEREYWRQVTMTVGFSDSTGRMTSDVATIMQRAGWQFAGATFSLERLRFTRRDGDIYEVDSKGVCGNCGTVASVVRDNHFDPDGSSYSGGDLVRCEWTRGPDRGDGQ